MKHIKIFGTPWHLGHQVSLLKLADYTNAEFTWIVNPFRKWADSIRKQPEHLNWATHYEPGKYDVAILHIDQQCVDPTIGKGMLYRQLNETIQDIPKIVINHGTPMWPELGVDEDVIINGGEIIRKGEKIKIEGMKKMIGNNTMVVNSHEAVKRWGWGQSIIHGMDNEEWQDGVKEPRAITMISPAGLDKYYNRRLLSDLKTMLREKYGYTLIQITVDYEAKDFNDYKRFLGNSLVYVNPTLDSPMPRGRTEAMLSGCCVLTTKYHDADTFIENGKNGFIIPNNPETIVDLIGMILNEGYKEAAKIGQEGKKTAQRLFSNKRFLKDWMAIINKVLASKKEITWNGSEESSNE